MSCEDVKKRLNAWLDGELPGHDAGILTDHLAKCEACRNEVSALKQLSEAMDAMPVVRAPSSFSRNARRLFRNHIEQQKFSEWWQGLSMILRGAVCGAVLTGLVFGAVLGKGLTAASQSVSNPYLNIHSSKEYIP